jgi:hypothetical protein
MAGAGFKTWVDGDILTAADVNTYLMEQAVMVFADASARTTALTAPSEGMVSYLADSNVVEVYTGAAWVSLDDPNAIQNSIVDAKGDLISATADNTPARLAVGTNGQVLTADSAETTGLKWATPSGGGLVFIAGSTVTAGTTVSFNNCFSNSYENYRIVFNAVGTSSAGEIRLRLRASGTDATTSDYRVLNLVFSTSLSATRGTNDYAKLGALSDNLKTGFAVDVFAPFVADRTPFWSHSQWAPGDLSSNEYLIFSHEHNLTNSYDGFTIYRASTGTFTGTIRVYGYQNS